MSGRSNSICPRVEALESRRLMSAYAVTDLGPVGTGGSVSATLNAHGQVLIPGGSVATSSIYSNGAIVPLTSWNPKLAKHRHATPMFIDDAGDIVGTVFTNRTVTSPGPDGFPETDPLTDVFLFDGKRFRDLGLGVPMAVAGKGVVVWQNSLSGRVYEYLSGKRHLVPTPDTFEVAAAGQGDVVFGGYFASLYSAATGKTTRLPIVAATNFAPNAVNTSDQIAGTSSTAPVSITQISTFLGTASVFSNGQLTSLGTLGGAQSSALGINDADVVVGTSDTTTGSSAFIDSNGQMSDLQTLAPASETGWSIQSANAINDARQILATGVTPSDPTAHLLLLTPTP